MNPKEQVTLLRSRVKEELDNCNSRLWPTLCKLKGSPEGYEKIERMVIEYVAKEAMPIGSAIALIEQEMQHINQD